MHGPAYTPAHTQRVLGHDEAIHHFMSAWYAGRMHHAWLLTGPAGIGKASLAYAMARWLMADDRPRDSLFLPATHKVFKQVASHSCPTLCVIAPEEDEKSGLLKEITVDAARSITPFLRLTASDGQWRVVLVDRADLLNTESQNAILKILEEPPPRCLILLTADLPGRLLPTIRSRCRVLKCHALNEKTLKDVAVGLDLTLPSDQTWLLKQAAGSVGQLLHLTTLDAAVLHKTVDKLVSDLPVIDWPVVHKLAEKTGRKENDAQFRLMLDLFHGALSHRLHAMPAVAELSSVIQQKQHMAVERYLDRTATLVDMVQTAAVAMQTGRVAA